ATPVQIGNGRDESPRDPQPPAAGDKNADQRASAARPADARERKAVNDAAAFIRGLAEMRGRNAQWAEQAVRGAASLPAREALEQRVIDIVAGDLRDLLAQADGREVRANASALTLATRDAPSQEIAPDWRTRLLAIITDPNIAYLL